MAAYAEVASLLNNIEQMMAHPHVSTSFDKKQIESLHAKADDLLKFINTNNNYGVGSKEVEDLERQIASAARMAEDVIESHIVDQIHDQSIEDNPWVKTWIRSSFECLQLLDLQQIIAEMDAVMKRATEVGEKLRLREEMSLTHHGGEKAAERQPLTTAAEMSPVGLEDDARELIDLLCLDEQKRLLISIVGMGGSGKTTLVRNVYDNLLIKEKFHIRAWATVSQQYSAQYILSQLLSCLGIKGEKDDLGQKLYQSLFGRKYLIILDDIWSVGPWNEVRQFFPDNGNRSRIVLTTRSSDVARDCLSYSRLTMNLLDEDRSWKLLCRKAFQQESCPSLELENVGKEIASLCRGLPLSIVVIGGLLLNSPRTVGFWEGFARNIKSIPNAKEKQESLDVLSLSYNHLPSHLKPCFLYMGVFEEDSVIRVSTIITLWVSEGFVRPKGAQVLEEIAEDYLNDLISRNLVLVDKFNDDGRIRSFRLHDLIRDLCLNLGQKQDFFNVIIDGQNQGTERRLVCEGCQSEIGPPLARSIMARDNHGQPFKYKLLRVLDDKRYMLRPELFANVNLRYLAYHNPSDARELPTSLSLMWNLQTISLYEVVAPVEFWKMRHLRHVMGNKIYVPDPPPSNGQDYIMENLQTLTTVYNFKLSEEVCKIIPNIKKLSLCYHRYSHGFDEILLDCLCYLDRFNGLESLKLDMFAWLYRDIEMMNKYPAFPTSLRELSLENSKLHWKNLRMIGSLPHLQVLHLGPYSVTKGRKWSPVPGQFQQLKFLKIDKCRLDCWDADESHFPVLEKLLLHRLRYLKEIPLDIGDIPTLGLIRVELCREVSIAISAMRIKKDQLENQGIDALQIQLKIGPQYRNNFRKMVEEEGLNIDDIQLDFTMNSLYWY